MWKRLLFVLTLLLFILPFSVYAKAEVYDVVLFFGQSNMTGYAGFNVMERLEDSRVSLEDFSSRSGIDSSILDVYSSMNHVDVPVEEGTAYEYYMNSEDGSSNEGHMVEITPYRYDFGENLKWNVESRTFVGYENGEKFYASQFSYGTNMIPQFVKTYHELTGRKVVAVLVSNGGEEIAHFLPHDDVLVNSRYKNDNADYVTQAKNQYIYEAMVAKYSSAIQYMNNHPEKYIIGKKFYIVFQGEADVKYINGSVSGSEMTSQNYADLFTQVHNNLKADLGIEYGGIVETAHQIGNSMIDGVNGVNSAQKSLINNNSKIFLASDFPYKHFVPNEANYSGKYAGESMSYSDARRNALYSMCVIDGDESNSIHFTSAGLSQIGLESAESAVEYLNDNNNWLKSLKILDNTLIDGSVGSDSNNFEVNVSSSTKDVDIFATTFHTGLQFVEGFGPRNVKLENGQNIIQLKVAYQNGNPKVYTITINRGGVENSANSSNTPIKNTIDNIVEEVVKVEDTLAKNPVIVMFVSLILIIIGLVFINSGIKNNNL